MAVTIEFKRRIEKIITGVGVTPTVPASNDHTDGSWVITDIYEGEFCLNTTDGVLYQRVGNSIKAAAVDGMSLKFEFGGQAHGGYYVDSFSASKTFNANNGNNQEMVVTSSTTINITNELPGTYIITLPVSGGGSPNIIIGASFGTAVDNNAVIKNSNGDINIITLVVRPGGSKYYTINTITA